MSLWELPSEYLPGSGAGRRKIKFHYIVQQLVTSADSFPLMAIPLFILAGELMSAGGVSKRILNVCNVFFGRITGALPS